MNDKIKEIIKNNYFDNPLIKENALEICEKYEMILKDVPECADLYKGLGQAWKTDDFKQGIQMLSTTNLVQSLTDIINSLEDERLACNLYNFLSSFLAEQSKIYFQCIFTTTDKIIQSTLDLRSTNCDETTKNRFDDLFEIVTVLRDVMHFIEAGIQEEMKVQIEILEFFDLELKDGHKNGAFINKETIQILRDVSSTLIVLFSQATLITMVCCLASQDVYEFFSTQDKEKKRNIQQNLNEIASLIRSQFALMQQKNEENIKDLKDTVEKGDKETQNIAKQAVKNTETSIDLENTIITNQVADKEKNSNEHKSIEEEINKRNKLNKTKQLKLTTCHKLILELYFDENYRYYALFPLHKSAIKKMLSSWNQYLKTEGKKGKPPLRGFDEARHKSIDMFKLWVKETFFPDYQFNYHADALNRASRHYNINDIPSDQDIIKEVDKSLAEDKTS